MINENDKKQIEKKLLERFLTYVRIETTSDPGSGKSPSTDCQFDLLKLLENELKSIGAENVVLDPNGYLRAFIPPSPGMADVPVAGFLAHVDTSPDVTGKNVNPLIHDSYSGEMIILQNAVLDPAENPQLEKYRGETIITSDGTTLLGADDKAGIAEIITAAEYIIQHSDIKHGGIEIFFTPDEEIGRGMNNFPFKKAGSVFCYTLDGDGEGPVESECFNAWSVNAKITGKVMHLGSARGRMINSVKVAAEFISMIPAGESPETTDGREGYYCPHKISGTLEETSVELLLRDFEKSGMDRRIKAVKDAAHVLEKLYPGCRIELAFSKQYSNMKEYIGENSPGLELLYSAVRAAGVEPEKKIIRGGTDGARMSEMGIPCPNIFTGGYNYHSRTEWAALSSMIKASVVMINLTELWAEYYKSTEK